MRYRQCPMSSRPGPERLPAPLTGRPLPRTRIALPVSSPGTPAEPLGRQPSIIRTHCSCPVWIARPDNEQPQCRSGRNPNAPLSTWNPWSTLLKPWAVPSKRADLRQFWEECGALEAHATAAITLLPLAVEGADEEADQQADPGQGQ